jgi:hypothetical protein
VSADVVDGRLRLGQGRLRGPVVLLHRRAHEPDDLADLAGGAVPAPSAAKSAIAAFTARSRSVSTRSNWPMMPCRLICTSLEAPVSYERRSWF